MENNAVSTVEPVVQPAEQTDAKVESSTTKGNETVSQPSDAGNVTTEKLPFNKDPELQKYIERQVSKREQAFTKQLQQMKDEYTKKLESFNEVRVSQGKPEVNQLPPEQEQSLMQLAEMMFSHKAIREKYGLDKVSQLEKQLTESSTETLRSQYESELGEVLDKYSKEYGYDKNELRDEFEEFVNSDPWFADKPYHKGSVQKAAKLYFSEKTQELAERAANLKLIKEQKEKKSVATESPSAGKSARSTVRDRNLDDYLSRRELEEGGLKFD